MDNHFKMCPSFWSFADQRGGRVEGGRKGGKDLGKVKASNFCSNLALTLHSMMRRRWQYFHHFVADFSFYPNISFSLDSHSWSVSEQWGGEGWGWWVIGMPSDWGLEGRGGQRDGGAQEGEGQGPPEGPELRLPCGSAWAAGKGRGREGRGSCRWINWRRKRFSGDFETQGADKLNKNYINDFWNAGGRAEQFSISRREGSCSEAWCCSRIPGSISMVMVMVMVMVIIPLSSWWCKI